MAIVAMKPRTVAVAVAFGVAMALDSLGFDEVAIAGVRKAPTNPPQNAPKPIQLSGTGSTRAAIIESKIKLDATRM